LLPQLVGPVKSGPLKWEAGGNPALSP